MSKVQMFNFAIEHKYLLPELENAALEVIGSGQFVLGPKVDEFEKSCATYLGVKFAIGVSSGTDALIMALMALNIGQGDEVICPSFSFFATSEAITRVGAIPVYVDIYPESFTINCEQVEAAITEKTKAIMPVHLFGLSAQMDKISSIAKSHKLFVIEDAAQAIGTKHNGVRVGGIGDLGCFSFFPTKNLGGFGEAGLVATNSEELYTKLKMIRNHGCHERYYHDIFGGNFRIDAIQAAMLNVKLRELPEIERKRKVNAFVYHKFLKPSEVLTLPSVSVDGNENGHTFNQFTLRVKQGLRDELKTHLNEFGIESMIYYPVPIHRQKCYSHIKEISLPETDLASEEVLSIPIAPHLTIDDLAYTATIINKFFAQKLERK